MTKVRGGRSILDELALVRRAVGKAGRGAIEHSYRPAEIEDIGHDLLAVERELSRLEALLEPILERIDKRATSHAIDSLEQRIIAIERWIARHDAEPQSAPAIYEVRKQEGR